MLLPVWPLEDVLVLLLGLLSTCEAIVVPSRVKHWTRVLVYLVLVNTFIFLLVAMHILMSLCENIRDVPLLVHCPVLQICGRCVSASFWAFLTKKIVEDVELTESSLSCSFRDPNLLAARVGTELGLEAILRVKRSWRGQSAKDDLRTF